MISRNVLYILVVTTYYMYKSVVVLSVSMQEKVFNIQYFSVGNSDSTLITTQLGSTVLIDGGVSYEITSTIFPHYFVSGCDLDIVVLTHPHADHIVGLNRIIELCDIDVVIYNEFLFDFSDFTHWKSLVSGIASFSMRRDSIFYIDDLVFHVLWPSDDYFANKTSFSSKDVNNTSILLLLDYGDFEVLFTGDAEDIYSDLGVEEYLDYIQEGLDIFKVPHHGSAGALDKEFLMLLPPRTAVIPVGKNTFGHPSSKVVNGLNDVGARVFRTDTYGTVRFTVDSCGAF